MYEQRVKKALGQWPDNNFLLSIYNRLQEGKPLTENQVRAFNNVESSIEKRGFRKDAFPVALNVIDEEAEFWASTTR
jgi:hypothetical protein